MATVNVINWKKEKVGQVDLAANVFEVEVKNEVLHSVVRWQLASRRQGTHMTKTKGLVSGGGKKPFKQKGTGNARQGSTRSPLMPGGGTMFGPVPRNYAYVLPKKMRKVGLSMALSHLFKEGKLFVVDSMASEGKTAELNKRLKSFGIKKAVLVDEVSDEKFQLAARNLQNFKYAPVAGINVFDLLKFDAAVITKNSINKIVERCSLEK
ncbi:50S ribosomal protein L4 [Pseudobdellovibrio exovorus]|uniref:Large ribosomal subunit protein uL4 n=1 Tax=Pseudobdellovibrio exovorus JSS TaxID=1184267 RepID=M4VDL5_9BACT|nr:50S ribosomal protein L4 [Pseudobdellovibrio exovorus]AGH96126.1 50S ribosomal protein L4 [Pseudobdellovibrio exovorus JSS]